jgi:hypothetical protein
VASLPQARYPLKLQDKPQGDQSLLINAHSTMDLDANPDLWRTSRRR